MTTPDTAATEISERASKSRQRPERWACVCAFAKSVSEKDPFTFPRAGLETNVLYRCRLIIKHKGSEVYAIQPETKECCREWFDHAD